jgi:hypothetical protein
MVLSTILAGGVGCTAINVDARITRQENDAEFKLNQTKVVRLKTVNLTRFGTLYQYENLIGCRYSRSILAVLYEYEYNKRTSTQYRYNMSVRAQ